MTHYLPGLENVIASETSISFLDVEKEEIVVRGYDLIELARAYDLSGCRWAALNGTLPNADERHSMKRIEIGLWITSKCACDSTFVARAEPI